MNNEIKVVPTNSKQAVNINHDSSSYYAYLAKQWAIAEKLVNNEGYSAKYYADRAKTLIQSSVSELTSQMEEVLDTVSEQVTYVEQKASEINSANNLFQEDINTINSELLLKADSASVTSSLAEKANIDFSNCTKPYLLETYHNGNSWYRVWSDGWCEQGSMLTVGGDTTGTYSLVKAYPDTNYECLLTLVSSTTGMNNASVGPIWIVSKTNSTFRWANDTWGGTMQWVAYGYVDIESEEEEVE